MKVACDYSLSHVTQYLYSATNERYLLCEISYHSGVAFYQPSKRDVNEDFNLFEVCS
jgi:hypothetical protein